MSLDSALKLLRDVNNEIMARVEREGISERVKVARDYFIDAIDALLDKKVNEAIELLKKSLEVLSR